MTLNPNPLRSLTPDGDLGDKTLCSALPSLTPLDLFFERQSNAPEPVPGSSLVGTPPATESGASIDKQAIREVRDAYQKIRSGKELPTAELYSSVAEFKENITALLDDPSTRSEAIAALRDGIAERAKEQRQAYRSSTNDPKEQITTEFVEKLVDVSKQMNCHPIDLIGLIDVETGGQFRAGNYPDTGTVGLIQFTYIGIQIPELEKHLGTTDPSTMLDRAAAKSITEQLETVRLYLNHQYQTRMEENEATPDSFEKMYTAIFAPAALEAVSGPEGLNTVLYGGGAEYRANESIDLAGNRNGQIEAFELIQRAASHRTAISAFVAKQLDTK